MEKIMTHLPNITKEFHKNRHRKPLKSKVLFYQTRELIASVSKTITYTSKCIENSKSKDQKRS